MKKNECRRHRVMAYDWLQIQEWMMDKKAAGLFRNPYNCAQAVMKAFQETHSIPDAHIDALGSCGGGRAEGGACGALHAARLLVTDEERQQLDKIFAEEAGGLTCREVRSLKKLSCEGCVAMAARLVQQTMDEAEG